MLVFRSVFCMVVLGCWSCFGLAQNQSCALAKTEDHNIPTINYGSWKCSEEEAVGDIVNQLIEQAEKQRAEKCPSRTCQTAVPCTCNTKIQHFERIKSKIAIEVTTDKTCKRGLAYRAALSPDNGDKFKSECACVPKEREENKEKTEKKEKEEK